MGGIFRAQKPRDLRDAVVLITGAASGIGRATARAFAAAGTRLVLADINGEGLETVRAELAETSVPILTVTADTRRDDDLAALVSAARDEFGRIDVLVNNAGRALGGPIQQQDPARLRAMLETNLYGAMRLTQLVVPLMLAQGDGHLVFISSTTAPVPAPGLATYGATKAALWYFGHAVRHELAGTGIGVSVVMPGWTRTPMVEAVPEGPIREAGITADPPEVPAAAIVEAVRHGRAEVMLGGRATRVFVLIQKLAPWLMPRIWRRIVSPAYLDAVSHL